MIKITFKKVVFAGVGLAMVASPLLASAQTVSASSNASLIAILTQLVQTLEQELQQLIAAQQNTTPAQSTTSTNSGSLTASPTSGAAPLAVNFTYSFDVNAMGAASDQFIVNFGDGTSGVMNVGNFAQISHTYTSAGTYTATLSQPCSLPANSMITCNAPVLASATITVTGSNSTQPSTTIDPSSLTASTGGKDAAVVTITGSASGVSQVIVNIKGQTPGYATVVNGRWSATIGGVYPNTYAVQIDDNDSGPNNGFVLAVGTLTVSASNLTQPFATPSISSITPNQGTTNTTVTIYGTNLSSATSIQFYGPNGQLRATIPSTATTFLSDTAASISFMVSGSFVGMEGGGTYQVEVVTPAGASNALSFTVNNPVSVPTTAPVPNIESFTASPTSVTAGQSVTLSWAADNVNLPGYGGSCNIYPSGQIGGQSMNGSNNDGWAGSYTFADYSGTATFVLYCTSSAKVGSPSAQQSLTVNASGQ